MIADTATVENRDVLAVLLEAQRAVSRNVTAAEHCDHHANPAWSELAAILDGQADELARFEAELRPEAAPPASTKWDAIFIVGAMATVCLASLAYAVWGPI